MKKKLLIISYTVIMGLSLFLWLKIFEASFFNKYLLLTPNLKNLTLDEASILLHNSNLKLEKMGEEFSDLEEGKLYSQIPRANQKIKKGRTIKVWVSKGKNTAVVPDFREMSLLDARVLAEQRGFIIKNLTYVDHKFGYNRVIATEPPEGSVLSHNDEISFLLSVGQKEENVRMPEIIGLTLEEARSILRENQLFIGGVTYISSFQLDSGIIIESNINRGEKIPPGSSVNVVVTE